MGAKEQIAYCKIKIIYILQSRSNHTNDQNQAQLLELAKRKGKLCDQDRAFQSPATGGAFGRASG